jgi:hypothetical protein
MTRIIGSLFGTLQRCANRLLVRPAGLGDSTTYRLIVEFNKSR